MNKGWETKRVGEVLAILRNGVNCKQDKKGQGDRISRIESISTANFDIDKVGYTVLSKSDKEKYRLNKGDILFSHINSPIHVGKTALFNSEEEVYHGVNLLLMRPKPFLDVKYLELYLKFLFQKGYWMRLCKQSVNQASVNQQDINKVEISFPLTLQEQRRIVFSIDEAFDSIGKAKANAEQNLKNARELFESYLQGVFANKGEEWEEKKVKELGITQTGTTPKTTEKENFGDFIPFIKPADIDVTGIGDLRYDNDGLSESGLKKGRTMASGSVLMVCIGATIGKVGYAECAVSCNQQINSLTLKSEYEPKFFYYAMSSIEFQKKVLLEGKGAQATLPIINKSKWENLTIRFPKTKSEQQLIVQKLDALSSETKRLESNYQQKLSDLEELKKSILQKAFNGELKVS